MKWEQICYSALKFNLHYQNIKKELETLDKFLKKNKVTVDSAIDIGCGDGRITEKLGKILGLSAIYGLDLNQQLLKQAEKRGVKTIAGDMGAEQHQETFEMVICYGSLHHAKDTRKFIANLKRISKRYILIVDNTVRNNFFHRLTGSKNCPIESSPYHIRKVEEITKAMEENGCRILATQTNRNANVWHDRSFILATIQK
jgi:2-polyprenyl-3-methyl-5-hydroxy-6-metoxy-1,4-benzoquinol methylase